MTWECSEVRFIVKKLDCLGMKYTKSTFAVLILFLATFWGTSELKAQSAYVSESPTYSASSAASTVDNSDQPQGLVTLHARVNEVNVLFIATDKHGRFVRDL